MPASPALKPRFQLPQFIKGETLLGSDRQIGDFDLAVPDLNSLTWPRTEPGPAFQVPIREIIDVLVATGERLAADPDGYLAEALEFSASSSDLERRIVENSFKSLPGMFTRQEIELRLEGELRNTEALEGWREVTHPSGKSARVRAFPPRLVHVLAGNVPSVAAVSVIRSALTKGVHLFKLPSNDLFSAPAILRTMAAVAPGHPVVRSFSAVYWRGGDEKIESLLFRPQFFDKLVAWGGESALRSAKNYIGPGFELVSFDPKTSISFVGREAFESAETVEAAAKAGALDATGYNQTACVASRFQFVEGSEEQVDSYCEALHRHLGVPHETSSESAGKTPEDIREEVEGLRMLEPIYRVWGRYDGTGLVVRSDEPVEFHPVAKTVNVVRVDRLDDAIRYVTVATQTVGLFPAARKAEYRDRLASAGTQRVVTLGSAFGGIAGTAHDGFFPIHRFMRWVNDED
ncbi:long-chain-fatty-acyl-CoA reductase [Tardibacter chloracetimidivorans]|uniref:Acyl-CoA reductase n=1 Tax=Tardibacter chloracetimidivorans TaxID=1921510 RepID=A0A1L3ZW81_9SPHN|nr:acyl-CoA reductase [Tardibacter chloracetimidivorans]API59887.1 long-chain-fatty-acyl-CoA reductase [Tardibacter chloracetimidivorans]